jgi:hypothetical protein
MQHVPCSDPVHVIPTLAPHSPVVLIFANCTSGVAAATAGHPNTVEVDRLGTGPLGRVLNQGRTSELDDGRGTGVLGRGTGVLGRGTGVLG